VEALISYERLFSLGGNLVMPFWLLMIVLPHWRWTKRIIQSPWIAIGPALIYVALVLPQAANLVDDFGGLSDVARLLGTPFGATASWVHFLAFDLLVGRWAYLDSRERRVSALLMAPILFGTFMLGPIGFVAYLIVRTVYQIVHRRTHERVNVQHVRV
jgi:hypothetical protein